MAKNLSGDLMVASANRLADGVVVFLDDAGEWTHAARPRRRRPRQACGRDPAGARQGRGLHRGRPLSSWPSPRTTTACSSRSRCARRSASRASPSTPSRPMRCVMPDTHFYRYDDYDRTLVAERVEQFRDQVRRRLVGRAHRGAVQAAAAHQRPLPAAPRLHAAHRHSLRHAVVAPAAQAGRHRAQVRPRLRPFHDAPEPAAQLDQARGRARRAGGAGRSRHARHADLRQCHPQRHGRPFRRRRARRDRGSAHLVRDRAPVVDAASRVQLPAAQVQDRHHRLAQRPRRGARARHRPAPVAQRGGARSASR